MTLPARETNTTAIYKGNIWTCQADYVLSPLDHLLISAKICVVLAHVAGWGSYDLLDLAFFPGWIWTHIFRSCTTSHKGSHRMYCG